jgi:release factor glutamine methyltransferase
MPGLTIAKAQHSAAIILNSALEASVLLCEVLNVSRTYLIAHSNKILDLAQQQQFESLVQRRKAGEPIAYIVGKKEFWSLELDIDKNTLIPRPETELLVETVLQKLAATAQLSIVDLGTGSGAIALALASERPNWKLFATDQSAAALKVSQHNAQKYKLNNIEFYQGNWFEALPQQKFDAIISNPPYIADTDPHLMQGDLRFEPKPALIAGENGFADLFWIIQQSRNYLTNNGWVFLEHGSTQAVNLQRFFTENQFQNIETIQDLAGLDRVTFGQITY